MPKTPRSHKIVWSSEPFFYAKGDVYYDDDLNMWIVESVLTKNSIRIRPYTWRDMIWRFAVQNPVEAGIITIFIIIAHVALFWSI